MALQDRFANCDFVMAVFGCCEEAVSIVPSRNGTVDRAEEHLESVRETLDSPRGRWRVLCQVVKSARTDVILAPSAKETVSIQCVPMSATARSWPPSWGSRRQL